MGHGRWGFVKLSAVFISCNAKQTLWIRPVLLMMTMVDMATHSGGTADEIMPRHLE